MNGKQTHFSRIAELIGDIRKIIEKHHKYVDEEIAKFYKQQATDTERLNESTLSFETKKNRTLLQSAVKWSADQCVRDLKLAFDDIQAEINAWSLEPPSDAFLTLMGVVDTFNLDLSVDELKTLSAAAAGSYFGEKVLAGYASKHASLRYPFADLGSLTQMIRNAKADCTVAVSAYAGSTANNTALGWVTDDISKRFMAHHRILADTFLNRDESSLTDLQDALSTATDSSISLIPNEQQRIAAMFDGVRPEDRFDHMKQLILDHPELELKLSVYDKTVYQKAKDEIRNMKEEEYQRSLAATREASRKAVQAKAAALKEKL